MPKLFQQNSGTMEQFCSARSKNIPTAVVLVDHLYECSSSDEDGEREPVEIPQNRRPAKKKGKKKATKKATKKTTKKTVQQAASKETEEEKEPATESSSEKEEKYVIWNKPWICSENILQTGTSLQMHRSYPEMPSAEAPAAAVEPPVSQSEPEVKLVVKKTKTGKRKKAARAASAKAPASRDTDATALAPTKRAEWLLLKGLLGEAEEWLPGVTTCQVKTGYDTHCARLIAPERAHRLIAERTTEALRRRTSVRMPELEYPVTLRWELVERHAVPTGPDVTVIDARTYEKSGDSVEKLLIW